MKELKTYISVEHLGSTSVKGMVAKPIIDIMVVVPNGMMDQAISELARLHYRHQGDLGITGREAYESYHLELPTHHPYTCYADNYQLHGWRAFRAFLTKSSLYRERLSQLKLTLDQDFGSDRQKYMQGKRELVNEIVELAKREFPELADRPHGDATLPAETPG